MGNVIENTPFCAIAMVTFKGVTSKLMYNYNILYILKGAVRIKTEDANYFLDEQDVILLNPHDSYTVFGSNDNLVLSIILDSTTFNKGKSIHTGRYICNSSIDNHRDYTFLRQLLAKIGAVYFNKNDISNLNLASLGYQLLYYLNSTHYEENLPFMNVTVDSKYSDRINDILTYIHQNYQQQISLQELADYTHLSSSYLSKFFKKTLDTNFNQYLNHVRMHHAIDDLLNTENSIMSVAENNGFPNINSFNKMFKEEYGTTPKKYRDKKLTETDSYSDGDSLTVSSNPESQLKYIESLAEDYKPDSSTIVMPDKQIVEIDAETSPVPIKPLWRSMINMGSAEDVDFIMEKLFGRVMSEMSFAYSRLFHVFSPKHIVKKKNGAYDYFRFSEAMVMINNAHTLPYLELGDNPDNIRGLYKNHPGPVAINEDEYMEQLRDFCVFSSGLYNTDTISNWKLEISWMSKYQDCFWENPKTYAARFAKAYRLIKEFFPSTEVGGPYFISSVPIEIFEEILKGFVENDVVPDFMSFGIFPYGYTCNWNLTDKSAPTPKGFYSTDEHYALNKILQFKKLMQKYKMANVPVHISALSTGVHTSVALNDSVYQSSFFTQSTIDLAGEVDIVGYFQMGEAGHHEDSGERPVRMANGYNGMLNRYAVYKPGIISLSRFMMCSTAMLGKGSNYIVTKKYTGSYFVAFCNHLHPSDEYCMNMVEPPVNQTYSIFKAPKTNYIDLNLKNVEEGQYVVLGFRINREHGSVLDEWENIDFYDTTDTNELDHIKNIVTYKRTLTKRFTTNGTLNIPIQMAPHEVMCLLIEKIGR